MTPTDNETRRQLAEAQTPNPAMQWLEPQLCRSWARDQALKRHIASLLARYANEKLAAAHAREAALAKERDEWIVGYERLHANFNHQEWQIADLAREVERLRAALKNYLDDLDNDIDPASTSELREVLAAPTPAAVEQWRAERELRDAAVELAEADMGEVSTMEQVHEWQRLAKTYRALRAQRTATPGSEGA